MDITKVIEQFKNLDLTKYPKDEILNLFKQFGNVGYIVIIFHKGKSIMRARPNYNNVRFNKKIDYSFKPSDLNKTYQRASTPNQTMFYATSIPDKIEKDELDNMRVIGVAETIPMLRDKTQSGLQKISFGRWYVYEDVFLVAIVQKDKYYNESNYTRELVNGYKEFIKSQPAELAEQSLAFQTFLADEFAKEEIRDDYDYMISAIFSELVLNKGFDGVLYPSVRVGGKGFNVALSPNAIGKLKLNVAGECTVYKLKDHTVVDNNAIVELKGTEDEFNLKEIESHEKACLEKLGVETIEDLK
jgi:hypothetical protein